MQASNLAVIILTLNQEPNLPHALMSVCGWADEVHVVDAGSTDLTCELALARGCVLTHHPFQGHAAQCNYALRELPIAAEWVLFLEPYEQVSPRLREEISRLIASRPEANGFLIKRRLIWMNRFIRHGDYGPVWSLRLVRRRFARCLASREHAFFQVSGAIGKLRADLLQQDRKGLDAWIDLHNRTAPLQAKSLLLPAARSLNPRGGYDSCPERSASLHRHIWNRLPPMFRPFLNFSYHYFLLGGFLDGVPGFCYHFLEGFWYPLLVNYYFREMRRLPALQSVFVSPSTLGSSADPDS